MNRSDGGVTVNLGADVDVDRYRLRCSATVAVVALARE